MRRRGRKAVVNVDKDRAILVRMTGLLHARIVKHCDKIGVSLNTWATSQMERGLDSSPEDDKQNPYLVRALNRLEKHGKASSNKK